MDYPEVIDYSPLHIDAQALRERIAKYGDDPELEKVAFAIATYANPCGVAFPGLQLLSDLTGLDWKVVSVKAHLLQSAGALTIRRVKSKGAEYSHNVYTFVKKIVRKSADVTSAHFIANVKKWRAEGRDVAQAIKKKARQSLDTLTAKAEKMAQLFQERPELMDDPERAAQIAGVADNPSMPNVSDAMGEPVESVPSEMDAPAHTAPITWENGESWDSVPTEPMPKPSTAATATLARLFGIPEPSAVKPVPSGPLDNSPLPLYYQQQETATATVEHTWRDNVPGYEEKAAV